MRSRWFSSTDYMSKNIIDKTTGKVKVNVFVDSAQVGSDLSPGQLELF